jgi:hypothetical protein
MALRISSSQIVAAGRRWITCGRRADCPLPVLPGIRLGAVSLDFAGILCLSQFTEYSPNQESVEQRRGNYFLRNARRR